MTNRSHLSPAPEQLGFLLDELRSAGLTTYADLATALNRQGLRPQRGRWHPHALYLIMRRHRRTHPHAALNVGSALYARRAEEARRAIRRLKRRGLKTQAMIAAAVAITRPVSACPTVMARRLFLVRSHSSCFRLTRNT